jgi:hypothetical protein
MIALVTRGKYNGKICGGSNTQEVMERKKVPVAFLSRDSPRDKEIGPGEPETYSIGLEPQQMGKVVGPPANPSLIKKKNPAQTPKQEDQGMTDSL